MQFSKDNEYEIIKNNDDDNDDNKQENRGIFSIFKEQTQNFAKGLLDIARIDKKIYTNIVNKINKDKNQEVRDKIENNDWEVKGIEKSNLDKGNNKTANKILDIITADEIDLVSLKEICRQGVPPIMRCSVWKILLGITPLKKSDQEKKRTELTEEYKRLLLKHYRDSSEDENLHHQIRIDCVRTSIQGFQHVYDNQNVIELLNRVLYIWSKEHSEVNYFQGLNEILAPIVFFYLCEHVDINSSNDLSLLSSQDFAVIEIDSYFSVKQILDWVMNDYESNSGSVYAGPMVKEITQAVQLNLPSLYNHLQKLGIDYNVVCFRWALCLLCRDMNILNVGRLFDNYLAMGQSFPKLHPYVCVAILELFSDKILPLEFSETIMVLQRLVPSTFSQTKDMDQINPLLKRAQKLKEKDDKYHKTRPKEILPNKKEDEFLNNNNNSNNNNNINDNSNNNNNSKVETQSENDLTTSILVGGVVLTLFTAALISHAGKKIFKKK